MIYYRGHYGDAMLVASDVEANCPDLLVGRVPSMMRRGRTSPLSDWIIVVATPEEVPMLEVFSFTDEKRRTFRWGMDDDRGETVMLCNVYQDFSLPVETPEGPKVRGMQVMGAGKGSTAQIAYDAALADLVVNLKDAAEKLKSMDDVPTTDVSIDEGPHRLFGKPGE